MPCVPMLHLQHGKSKQHVLCKSEPSLERECDSWITSNQSKAECGQDCLRTALYLELGQDMAHMRLYCIFGHVQVLGNILIRLAQGKQVQYILFALSQGFRSLWHSQCIKQNSRSRRGELNLPGCRCLDCCP